MLKVVRVSHPQEKQKWLEAFDPDTQTWLVSDLRSKFEIQQKILKTRAGYEDWTIYRASELWRLLLKRVRPEMQIVPRDFALSLLRDRLQQARIELSSNLLQPQSSPTLLGLMDLFAPLFYHADGESILKEFFLQEPLAAERFELWSSLAKKFFDEFLEQKWILPSWIPALLNQSSNLCEFWQRPLFVDLGANLRQSEVELFKQIAKEIPVTIFIPKIKNEYRYRFLLEPGLALMQETPEKDILTDSAPATFSETRQALRFSSPLAEVKHVVATARSWVESGVSSREIAVIAPDIEQYWPLLEPMLRHEGLPVDKDTTSRLQSRAVVGVFLSKLRLRTKQVLFADTELALFQPELKMKFEKFRALFCQALTIDDLQKEKSLEHFFALEFAPSAPVSFEAFMSWAAKDWPDHEDWSSFEIFVKEILLLGLRDLTLQTQSWISYLESLAAKKEIRVRGPEANGLQLLNLSEAESRSFEKRIILGLTESNFKKKTNPLLSTRDLQRLGWDFGFFLDHPEQNVLNFELEWTLLSSGQELHLCFPSTGFGGQAEAPHPEWIKSGGDEKIQQPEQTRWDEIQKDPVLLTSKMQRDLGLQEVEAIKVMTLPSMSASSLEKFRGCAFQFAAEKWFYLLDYPERDLDLDARSKGQLQHRMFEQLTSDPDKTTWTDQEIIQLIEQARVDLGLSYRDGVFWKIDLKRSLELAKRFLNFEKLWRENFRDVKIQSRECKFEFYFDPKEKKFFSDSAEGRLSFKGSIDRVESHPNGYLNIIDYKPSWESKRSFGSWIKSNFLQLAIYAWAVDRGFVSSLPQNSVAGIQTYTYQPLRRDRGFIPLEIVGTMAPKPMPKEATLATKESLYQDLEQILISSFELIEKGKITPFPLNGEKGDFSLCDRCHWSDVCRAPHLN